VKILKLTNSAEPHFFHHDAPQPPLQTIRGNFGVHNFEMQHRNPKLSLRDIKIN